jgi:hypothetical protein
LALAIGLLAGLWQVAAAQDKTGVKPGAAPKATFSAAQPATAQPAPARPAKAQPAPAQPATAQPAVQQPVVGPPAPASTLLQGKPISVTDLKKVGGRPMPTTMPGIPEPTVQLKPGEVPGVSFDTPTYDFGRIPAGDEVAHDFWFTNTGNGPLEIISAKPS